MPKEKQILIIEDQGIPREDFENLAKDAGLSFPIVWEEEKANEEQVEVLINVKKKVDKDYLAKYPSLKMIAVAFTGYDSVDLAYCEEKNIAVYNVPAYSTSSVTELAIGLSISLLREIPKANDILRKGEWNLNPGLELSGRTVGILGTGKIGINTAKVFKALGCNLIAWSRTEKEEFKAIGGKYISNKLEFFAAADILSIHLPYNKETENTIGKEELEAMKMTAFLINTARGPIIDEKALITALKNKQIAGAGLDVFNQEPIPSDNELIQLDNVILTPHIAYKTEEALTRRAQTAINNINYFLEGKQTNRVN